MAFMDTEPVAITIKIYQYMTKFMIEFVKERGSQDGFNKVVTDLI